jgi:DNA-binding transcriptional LysR family regulator
MDATGDMRAFVKVVEQQSFAAAATALGLSPSAVSKLVTRLEDRLGVELLHRTTRRLSLTSEGEVFFARARQILADIAEAEIEVTRSRGAPRGRLRVNTSNGFGIHQLAPALPDFMARYPEIEIDLVLTDRIVDISVDPADVIIRAGPVADVDALSFKIADFERVVCASPAYLARHGSPRTPAELADHTCVVIASQLARGWPFRMADGIQHVELKRHITVDNSEAALRLVLNGGGITRLGDVMVADLIANGSLVSLLADVHHAEPLRLSALYLEGRHRLPKVRVFLEFLTERFASTPWRVDARKALTQRRTR